MAKTITQKVTDQIISMITRDIAKTAWSKTKEVFMKKAKPGKKLKKKAENEDIEEDLEP